MASGEAVFTLELKIVNSAAYDNLRQLQRLADRTIALAFVAPQPDAPPKPREAQAERPRWGQPGRHRRRRARTAARAAELARSMDRLVARTRKERPPWLAELRRLLGDRPVTFDRERDLSAPCFWCGVPAAQGDHRLVDVGTYIASRLPMTRPLCRACRDADLADLHAWISSTRPATPGGT